MPGIVRAEAPDANATFLAWTGGVRLRSLASVIGGACTPEELETLLEDVFVTRDRHELAALFDDGAVLASTAGAHEARGGEAIGRTVAALWDGERTYVAGPRRVLQARALALVVARSGIHVVRQGEDRNWRAAISLLDLVDSTTREDT